MILILEWKEIQSSQSYNRKRKSSSSHSSIRRSRSRSNSKRRYKSYRPKKVKVIMPKLDGQLVSFRVFMEIQQENIDREKALELYNQYKKDWEKKQIDIFYSEHKQDQWFQEKYNPYQNQRLQLEKKIFAQKNAEYFMEKLKNGKYEKLNLEIDQKIMKDYQENNQDDNQSFSDKEGEQPQKQNIFHTEVFLPNDYMTSPYFGFDPNSMTLFIKSVPKNISRWEIKQVLEKLQGFQSLSLSEPLRSNDFIRFGWILFDSEENCSKAAQNLQTMMIKNYAFTIVKSRSQKRPVKISSRLDKQRVQIDLNLTKKLIKQLDEEKCIEKNLIIEEERDMIFQLDLQLLYLRKVHSLCYYCAAEYYDERMLSAKCGPTHLRLKVEEEELPMVPDWHTKVVDFAQSRAQQSNFNRNFEQEIENILIENLQQKSQKLAFDDLTKWPCLNCDKVFQAENFVIKHMRAKHEEQISEARQKILEPFIYKNYTQDKNKIIGAFQIQNEDQKIGQKKYQNKQRKEHYQKVDRSKLEYQDLDDPQFQLKHVPNRRLINYNDI